MLGVVVSSLICTLQNGDFFDWFGFVGSIFSILGVLFAINQLFGIKKSIDTQTFSELLQAEVLIKDIIECIKNKKKWKIAIEKLWQLKHILIRLGIDGAFLKSSEIYSEAIKVHNDELTTIIKSLTLSNASTANMNREEINSYLISVRDYCIKITNAVNRLR